MCEEDLSQADGRAVKSLRSKDSPCVLANGEYELVFFRQVVTDPDDPPAGAEAARQERFPSCPSAAEDRAPSPIAQEGADSRNSSDDHNGQEDHKRTQLGLRELLQTTEPIFFSSVSHLNKSLHFLDMAGWTAEDEESKALQKWMREDPGRAGKDLEDVARELYGCVPVFVRRTIMAFQARDE